MSDNKQLKWGKSVIKTFRFVVFSKKNVLFQCWEMIRSQHTKRITERISESLQCMIQDSGPWDKSRMKLNKLRRGALMQVRIKQKVRLKKLYESSQFNSNPKRNIIQLFVLFLFFYFSTFALRSTFEAIYYTIFNARAPPQKWLFAKWLKIKYWTFE